ncbi:MAG: restriction endonuclease subunit S [Tessaracoccus sp.]|uniref:restriction endonuclease subunit S n=1 Tax=Tessaracoccus sp. TaxID=1971211 RepID=UPI001EB75D68|nr:restriction endonuclease subunit S [Tessaracoccus sp.]MBK7821080.1 restriction endonuclease subunit S [Tessaracoccus sp.]
MSWERVRLRDLGTWYGGGTPSKANLDFWTGGTIPWLSPKDMGAETLADTQDHVTRAAITASSTKLVPAGSVAVVTRSGILERTIPVALVPFETTMNQDMKAVAPGSGIDARWIAWGLRAFERDLLRDTRKAGTTVASIEMPRWYNFELPVPPLEEQRRIIAILEDQLSRLDAADEQLRKARRCGAALLRSALTVGLRGELVPDDLSEGGASALLTDDVVFEAGEQDRVWSVPSSWRWARIGDLFQVNIGSTPPRGDSHAWSGDLPWVSSGEVSFCRLASTRETIERAAAGNPRTRIQPPGTILLAMIGEGKTRGQAAILDVEAAHNQNCASIRVSETQVLPEYIYGYLEERYLETRRGGAGGQQPALNKTAIQKFPVPIAPLATQRTLVSRWEELRENNRRLECSLKSAKKRSEALRRSLLTAAFSGRLTGSAEEMSVVAGRTGT